MELCSSHLNWQGPTIGSAVLCIDHGVSTTNRFNQPKHTAQFQLQVRLHSEPCVMRSWALLTTKLYRPRSFIYRQTTQFYRLQISRGNAVLDHTVLYKMVENNKNAVIYHVVFETSQCLRTQFGDVFTAPL